jgi:hypothetical protein
MKDMSFWTPLGVEIKHGFFATLLMFDENDELQKSHDMIQSAGGTLL